jgi:hypothetical protein
VRRGEDATTIEFGKSKTTEKIEFPFDKGGQGDFVAARSNEVLNIFRPTSQSP